MIENELKMMLSLEEYTKIMKQLEEKIGAKRTYLQINYYYDTRDFKLAASGDSLRIRQKNNNLILEYKCRKEVVNETRQCIELKQEINGFLNEIRLSDFFSLHENHKHVYVGNLVTERTNFEVENTVISLDRNFYLGKEDYELEIESSNVEEIKKIQIELELNYPVNLIGKYERFHKSLVLRGEAR